MKNREHRTGNDDAFKGHRYESEMMSLMIIVLVSAAGKFWHVLMVIATLGVLCGIGVLASELFVRGMAWNSSKMHDPWSQPAGRDQNRRSRQRPPLP